MGVTASAPAKVILFGEHFVVYGEPAIVLAIDKRVDAAAELRADRRIYVNSVNLGLSGFFEEERFQAECGGRKARKKLEPVKKAVQKVLEVYGNEVGVDVEIRSSIPVAAGLGSSAAVAAAVATAVSRLLGLRLSRDEIFHVALETERFVHGTPSGIDPAISTYGGVLLFRKEKGFTCLDVDVDIPLVVGDTGIERSTGELVAMVRRRRDRWPSIVDPIVKASGRIVLRAAESLREGNLHALGELMDVNHGLLCAVGVSCEPLDRLVFAARRAGALGAKLTGAGGGGCMVALCEAGGVGEVVDAIEGVGGRTFVARKADVGVRVEE